jgi:hypothetical protein
MLRPWCDEQASRLVSLCIVHTPSVPASPAPYLHSTRTERTCRGIGQPHAARQSRPPRAETPGVWLWQAQTPGLTDALAEVQAVEGSRAVQPVGVAVFGPLGELDEVAYPRLASVYRECRPLADLEDDHQPTEAR